MSASTRPFRIAAVLCAAAAAGCTTASHIGTGTPAPEAVQPVAAPTAEPEQWYFWTPDGVRHFVYDFGTATQPGDTVVVLHGGWGAEHSYLIAPLEEASARYRFVLYDQRGSLRSPAPDSLITLSRLVADLEQLRTSLGLERLTLVTHSMGAALAYAYLAAHPDRVRGLVLLAPVLPASVVADGNVAFIREVWPGADMDALRVARDSFMADVAERSVAIMRREGLIPDSMLHIPPAQLNVLGALRDRERTRAWRISFAAVNSCTGENWRQMEGGMVYYSQAAANALLGNQEYAQRAAEFWPALRAYQGPVRVIIGTCDYVDLGPVVWPHVVERLADARMTVIGNSGHNAWLDHPREFASALLQALDDIRR